MDILNNSIGDWIDPFSSLTDFFTAIYVLKTLKANDSTHCAYLTEVLIFYLMT